jgi:hypothetical protein
MIYLIQEGLDGPVKIGWTGDGSVRKRLSSLQTAHSKNLTCLATCEGTPKDEKRLHRRFRHLRIRGEWFNPTTELLGCFQIGQRESLNTLCLYPRSSKLSDAVDWLEKCLSNGQVHRARDIINKSAGQHTEEYLSKALKKLKGPSIPVKGISGGRLWQLPKKDA